ncbi:methyltransferase domain-containing protein [Streptomyces sp. NBC_00237]|uniref:SAM-dependent methyltransferase n=1 Tax=Streptomyces sp. NBC_00237 TaxID=2975687 RepID=UPI00224F0DA6|nr:methyltransferase domain-containing protein [Streptomyces sp. NBC_00237]MCX5205729.1 methyltransferase domain-containing protein [Streptomyces sp. NBC_00237]
MSITSDTAAASAYQHTIADYWNAEKNAVNHELGAVDNLFHHHYGIGPVKWENITDDSSRHDSVVQELHRLETEQGAYLISQLGALTSESRILDAGCGRGATSIMAAERFGCTADGITLSAAQAKDANSSAAARGVSDRARYQVANMLQAPFADGSFDAIWNNESTMYVELGLLFAEYQRLLKPGGRYVTITGCINDGYGRASRAVSMINAQYACDVHRRSEYFKQMTANRLVPVAVTDLTQATLPYWKLRATDPELTTGVEEHFIDAYETGAFQYLMIAADRV